MDSTPAGRTGWFLGHADDWLYRVSAVERAHRAACSHRACGVVGVFLGRTIPDVGHDVDLLPYFIAMLFFAGSKGKQSIPSESMDEWRMGGSCAGRSE